jgi:hypothetical protein
MYGGQLLRRKLGVKRPTSIQELNWLHDAEVEAIEYQIIGGIRSFQIRLKGHPDCGYPQWSGKRITIGARDVGEFSFRAPGWISGPEILDAARGESSDKRINIVLAFHSGAEIGFSCYELTAEI